MRQKTQRQTETKGSSDHRSFDEAYKLFEGTVEAAVTTPKSKVMASIKKDKEERQKKRLKKS